MSHSTHEDCLLFENGTEMFWVPMMVKRKFGQVLYISSMMLLKGAKGGRIQTIAHMPDETVSQK